MSPGVQTAGRYGRPRGERFNVPHATAHINVHDVSDRQRVARILRRATLMNADICRVAVGSDEQVPVRYQKRLMVQKAGEERFTKPTPNVFCHAPSMLPAGAEMR